MLPSRSRRRPQLRFVSCIRALGYRQVIAGWRAPFRPSRVARALFFLVITNAWSICIRAMPPRTRGGGGENRDPWKLHSLFPLTLHTHTPQPPPPTTPPPPSKEYCDNTIEWECDYGYNVADICQDQCPEVACDDLVRRRSRTLPRSLARPDHTHWSYYARNRSTVQHHSQRRVRGRGQDHLRLLCGGFCLMKMMRMIDLTR